MNFTNSNLPEVFRGCSPMMVNDLLSFGYSDAQVVTLIQYADSNDFHPDWSEDSTDEIRECFDRIASILWGDNDELEVSKLDRIKAAGGEDGVIFEFNVQVSVMIRGGVVVWSYCDPCGSLASINNAETGNEYSGEEYDEILDALGDISGSELDRIVKTV
jgi:hypothetical protein